MGVCIPGGTILIQIGQTMATQARRRRARWDVSQEEPAPVEELSGNVWEWTRSLWGEYPYPSERIARSKREDLQTARRESRVLRGGAFWLDPQLRALRLSRRGAARSSNGGIGFRVALAGPP